MSLRSRLRSLLKKPSRSADPRLEAAVGPVCESLEDRTMLAYLGSYFTRNYSPTGSCQVFTDF